MATHLLPHPPPFRASLAITSDIDGCSPAAFLALHRFFDELGLEVGDTFWFFSNNPRAQDPLTWFDGISEKPKHADLILEGIRKGWIDALHTYGDFEYRGGFHRGLAERALAEMARHGIRLSTWINHGGQFHNLQGVANPRRLGDVPQLTDMNGQSAPALEYHADLMVKAGLRFVWSSELTGIVGQERPCSALEYYMTGRPGVSGMKKLTTTALGLLPPARVIDKAIGYFGVPPFRTNDLIWPQALADGNMAYVFQRFGDYRRDGPEDIPDLLSPAVLDRLEETGGVMSFFTHLGKPRSPRAEALLPREKDCFRELARRQKEGRLRVCRTSRLLHEAMLRRSLRFHEEGDAVVIDAVDDPVFGRYVPEARELEGLCFATDRSRAMLAKVTLGGREIPCVRFPGGLRPAGPASDGGSC